MSKKKTTKAGQSIIQGMKEALAYERGARDGYRVHTFDAVDVAQIRKKTGMTQREFSEAFQISLPTLRHWEQGQRVPHGPAAVLLHVIAKNPRAVLDALH